MPVKIMKKIQWSELARGLLKFNQRANVVRLLYWGIEFSPIWGVFILNKTCNQYFSTIYLRHFYTDNYKKESLVGQVKGLWSPTKEVNETFRLTNFNRHVNKNWNNNKMHEWNSFFEIHLDYLLEDLIIFRLSICCLKFTYVHL